MLANELSGLRTAPVISHSGPSSSQTHKNVSKVLLVDDDVGAKDRLELLFLEFDDLKGLQIIHATHLDAAFDSLAAQSIDVVLLDKNLDSSLTDDHNGIEAIPEILRIQPHVQILVVTGSREIDDVVRAMKLGAFGYVTKDTESDLLATQIDRAVHVSRLKADKARRERSDNSAGQELGGRSIAFQSILRQADILSTSNRPILILGETGTGKTELAKWTHSQRMKALGERDRPFFSINVSALSKDLIESELFGHEKGAFTDASQARQGLFELANGGTLFLDEIGELPLDLQPKLLKVIEEGTFMRVGGTKELRSNPKLIFATHRDLVKMVKLGTFREDLFMRISIFPIQMPALSQRREDIPDIIRKLLPKACKENRVSIEFEDLPVDFIQELTENPVSGNIRGIQHQLERLLMLSPRGKDGTPILTTWRRVPGLSQSRSIKKSASDSLSFSEWTGRQWQFLGDDFPGLNEVLEETKVRILREAFEKYDNNRKRAKALKIFECQASRLFQRYLTTIQKRGSE